MTLEQKKNTGWVLIVIGLLFIIAAIVIHKTPNVPRHIDVIVVSVGSAFLIFGIRMIGKDEIIEAWRNRSGRTKASRRSRKARKAYRKARRAQNTFENAEKIDRITGVTFSPNEKIPPLKTPNLYTRPVRQIPEKWQKIYSKSPTPTKPLSSRGAEKIDRITGVTFSPNEKIPPLKTPVKTAPISYTTPRPSPTPISYSELREAVNAGKGINDGMREEWAKRQRNFDRELDDALQMQKDGKLKNVSYNEKEGTVSAIITRRF
jgi:hypothetical protein